MNIWTSYYEKQTIRWNVNHIKGQCFKAAVFKTNFRTEYPCRAMDFLNLPNFYFIAVTQKEIPCHFLDFSQNLIFLSDLKLSFPDFCLVCKFTDFSLTAGHCKFPDTSTPFPWFYLSELLHCLWSNHMKLEWAASNGNRYPPYPQVMATAISQ